MGEEMAQFNGYLTPRIEGGGRGNGHGMWCCAQGGGSMAGEAEVMLGGGAWPAAAVPVLFRMVMKKKANWGGWAKRSSRPVGRLGLLGQKLKEIPFRNKIFIFEYTKALEICTRRFRRNFDTRIFSKFF
jgi:hypothetical protein